MRLILVADYKTLGKAGDIVDVSEGHARNFLLPKGLAIEATAANIKEGERKKVNLQIKKEKEKKRCGAFSPNVIGENICGEEKGR